MALQYFIYSTGTTYATTIVRVSATNTAGPGESYSYADFVIPEIQPVYLWRITGNTHTEDPVPNTDANVLLYEGATAPPAMPYDLVTYAELTGSTANKIDKVTGQTSKIPVFNAGGNLQSSGYTIPQLTGLTTYTFTPTGGTYIYQNGNNITIGSTVPSGTTVSWTTGVTNKPSWLSGTTLQAFEAGHKHSQYLTQTGASTIYLSKTGASGTYLTLTGASATYLAKSIFNNYTGATQPILNGAVTGATNLGTGTTIYTGSVSNRKLPLKTLKGRGGLYITSDTNYIYLSATTGITSVNWSQITGPISGNTDLQNALNAKLNTSVFNNYTGTTQPILNAALTGATNGITVGANRKVELGGTITKDTLLAGTGFGLTANTKNILLQAINGINIIDTDGTGGVNIESDNGTIALIGNNTLGAEKTKLEISQSSMLITDSRTGATKVGLQYAGDYSATFTNESLITKRYADAIAGGLIPKAAVKVATTGAITLSGLTTIDGVALANGDRVLVKNQGSAATNGIYIASGSTWARSTDYDGNPSGEVSGGNIIPVLSGNTNHNTLWVLVTPNPITINVTPLNFSLYASPHYSAGVGIGITGSTIYVNGASLAGSSITWSGNTFNVNPATGNLATALSTKLNTSVFNGYTGATQPILNAALTGATNGLSLSGRKVKLGGQLTGNTTFDGTGSNYHLKYAGNYSSTFTPRSIVDKGYVTGVTSTLLPIATFTGYTATTKNKDKKIQLVHTGATQSVNTVAVTPIRWDSANPYATDIYTWTGGTAIKVLSAGTYEVQYHVTLKNDNANQTHSVGAYLIKNTSITIPITATAGMIVGSLASGELSLPPVVLTLAANDRLDLAAFRIGSAGTVNTVSGSAYIVLNKLT